MQSHTLVVVFVSYVVSKKFDRRLPHDVRHALLKFLRDVFYNTFAILHVANSFRALPCTHYNTETHQFNSLIAGVLL